MKKGHRIAADVKEQILGRIRKGEVSISQAATEHGVTDSTIYKWLGSKVTGTPSILEYLKLKRENDELLRLVGLITLKLNESQKKK